MKKNSPAGDRPDAVVQRVENLILTHRLLANNDTVIVAVSGGPDSVALLHVLRRLAMPLRLVAVYVNHGLRPGEIDAEIRLLEHLCQVLHVPFETAAVDVHAQQRLTGSSLEEAARDLRYAALEDVRRRSTASAIAVAHTADDQAEEVLLRLIRGSGRKGLAGMALRRDTLIRPLLQEKKQTLIDYLHRLDIPFCIDSSNSQRHFLRNKVRLDLLPYLEQNFNVSIRRNLLQTAAIFSEEEEYLEHLTAQAYERVISSGQEMSSGAETLRLSTQAFLDCHSALQRRVLEKACWSMRTRPGFRQIEQLRQLVNDGNSGAELHLGAGLRVWKTGREVLFSHPAGRRGYRGSGRQDSAITLTVEGPGVFSVAGHRLGLSLHTQRPGPPGDGELLLDADRAAFPLLLRSPLPGERFRPSGGTGRKIINRYLTDAKIPRHDRRFFPVLVSEGRVIAIAGLRIDHECRVTDNTCRFLHVTWRRL